MREDLAELRVRLSARWTRRSPDSHVLPFLLFPASALLERHAHLGTAHASLIAEILDILAGRVSAGQRWQTQ
jgi:hypothetical protein